MNTIMVLLSLVSSLILSVQQPNIPLSVKVQALLLAQQALSVAAQQESIPSVSNNDIVATTTDSTSATTTSGYAPEVVVASSTNATSTPTQGVPQLPALNCVFNATTTLDVSYWHNTYGLNPPVMNGGNQVPVQFSWSFTDGAAGVITGQGQSDFITVNSSNNAPIGQVMPKAFAVNTHPFDQVYTLTVSENGQSTTCLSEVTAI